MNKNRNPLISTFSSQLTASISVALVLLIIGLVGLLGLTARSIARDIKETMGFTIVMSDQATPADINRMQQTLGKAPYVSSYSYFSSEDAIKQWAEETGEDLSAIGISPFSAEFNVRVSEAYAHPDSISALQTVLSADGAIAEIVAQTQVLDNINSNINTIAIALAIVGGALLIISFILINNTVKLTVYSRRFIIHTMKLVGASGGFIRRPFLGMALIQGVSAGVVASAALAAFLYYAQSVEPALKGAIGWDEAVILFGAMILLGVIICVLASLLATNRYLRLSYDDMFS